MTTENEERELLLERDRFMETPDERKWRKNLKFGDLVYLVYSGCEYVDSHVWKVHSANIPGLVGIAAYYFQYVNDSRKYIQGIGEMHWYSTRTGRLPSKGANTNMCIQSRLIRPTIAERGLTQQEYMKRIKERFSLSPRDEEFYLKAWDEYVKTEELAGIRK